MVRNGIEKMWRARLALLLGSLLTLTGTAPAQSQHVPGAPGTDWDRARRDYTASVLREYYGVHNDWREHLEAGDMKRVLDHYSDGATLLTPGSEGAVQGRDSIGAALQRSMPTVLEIRTALSDFAASDYLAYATGPLMLTYRSSPNGPVNTVTGVHVTVMVREGRRWRIRSQVLQYVPPEAPARGGLAAPDSGAGGHRP